MPNKYIRTNEIIAGSLDDELIMMDIQQGKYFALNPTAKRIWELLEDEHDIEYLCQALVQEYEIDMETCKTQVEEVLNEMVKMKLVKVLDPSSTLGTSC